MNKAKRTYQDSLFRMLFSTKDKIIELFNALEGTEYGPDTEVEITTLEDVLYIDRKNDLGRTFEHLISGLKIYGKTLQKIPTPEFFVLYTGDEDWNVEYLCLSDAFISKASGNSVELVVKVVDIRYNENNEILKRSETLRGYSKLIFYIKSNQKSGMNLKDAIDSAVKCCMEENILRDFLKKHSQEVENMLFQEITWEEFAELRAEEAAKEAAKAAGIAAYIDACREFGVSKQDTAKKVAEKFQLTSEETESLLEKNWNNK